MQCTSRSPELLATPEAIAKHITPCLVLVAPVGMGQEQQATWAAAAFKALAGYSEREIERGARVAMREADHPSKIVPAIVRAIEALPSYSRDTGAAAALNARYAEMKPMLPPPAETAEEKAEREEVARLMADFVRKREAGAA